MPVIDSFAFFFSKQGHPAHFSLFPFLVLRLSFSSSIFFFFPTVIYRGKLFEDGGYELFDAIVSIAAASTHIMQVYEGWGVRKLRRFDVIVPPGPPPPIPPAPPVAPAAAAAARPPRPAAARAPVRADEDDPEGISSFPPRPPSRLLSLYSLNVFADISERQDAESEHEVDDEDPADAWVDMHGDEDYVPADAPAAYVHAEPDAAAPGAEAKAAVPERKEHAAAFAAAAASEPEDFVAEDGKEGAVEDGGDAAGVDTYYKFGDFVEDEEVLAWYRGEWCVAKVYDSDPPSKSYTLRFEFDGTVVSGYKPWIIKRFEDD